MNDWNLSKYIWELGINEIELGRDCEEIGKQLWKKLRICNRKEQRSH